MKRKILYMLAAFGLLAFTATGVADVRTNSHKVEFQQIKLQDTSNELKLQKLKNQKLDQQLDKALHDNSTSDQKIKQLEDEQQKSQQREQDLQKQLQAKLDAKQQAQQKTQAVATLSTPVAAAAPSTYVAGCGDNSYANYIYTHESGCRTTAVNSGGCYGIGQDCNGIVRSQCGADYACQNSYFTDYANRRYGGWAGAYSFWLNNHWW